jgi:hypothetical protein
VRVAITYHEQVRNRLRAWLAELAAREPGGHVIARVAIDLIRERFTECEGDPPEAVDDPDRGAAIRRWRFSGGFWLGYVVRDRGFGPWRSRRVIIAEARVCPPDSDPSGAARG